MHCGKLNIKISISISISISSDSLSLWPFAFCLYNVVTQMGPLSLSNQPSFFADAIRLWHKNVAAFKSKQPRETENVL